MDITFFSFFISILWSSIFIIGIYLCRKTRFFMYQFGATGFVLLYLFCIMRMVLPVDFIFTRGFSLAGVYSDVYECIAIHKIGESEISVVTVLFCIWIVVSVVLMYRFVRRYFITMRKVSSYAIREDEQCKRVFGCVINDSKKRLDIHVRNSEEVDIPIGIGVFNKSIVLPDETYSDKELYCILMHEYTHFLNRDLLAKMIIHIFRCIFWWNPLVYLLGRDVSRTLEIKCDLCVTEQMDNRGKADYLATIVSILKKADTAGKKTILCDTAGLVSKDCEPEIMERFKIVSGNHIRRGKNKILTTMWLFVFLAIFIFSYSFVIQPCYEAPIEEIETSPDTVEMRPDNTYVIKNNNGTYTVVMPGGDTQDIDEKYVVIMEKQGFKIIEGDE